MANKGMKNMFGGLVDKIKHGKNEKKESDFISEPREREKRMIARLKAIDLSDPQRQLSDEKVEELGVQGVIDYACNELSFPLIIDQDIKNLDADLEYIIKAVEDAVMKGRELTAEWACMALITAIKELRTDIAGVDQEFAKEIMECRVEYIQNLRLLVELCKDQDEATGNLNYQLVRRQENRDALDRAKNHFQARRDSGELDLELGELETKIHAPGTMSEGALNVRDELYEIHYLTASLIEKNVVIDSEKLLLNNRKAQIDSRRNALAKPPYFSDPKLNQRINEANERFRNRLRRTLNEVEQGMKDYNIHINSMKELANHSVFVMSTMEALQIVKKMEQERYEHTLAEQAALEKRIKAEKDRAVVEEQVRLAKEEHNRILEDRRNQVTVPVQEQETIENVEYELD